MVFLPTADGKIHVSFEFLNTIASSLQNLIRQTAKAHQELCGSVYPMIHWVNEQYIGVKNHPASSPSPLVL